MKNYFNNKVFIITGASSGIGRATALALANKGAKILVLARSLDKLKELQSECPVPENIIPFKADVSIENDCKNSIEKTVAHFGSIDGIIHNAGISMRALAAETDVSVFKTLMEVNYYSLVYFYKHGMEYLQNSKGHFAAVSSVQGLFSTQYRSGYAASKHAIQGFMDSIRLEQKDKQVHILTISPGFVNTNISLNALGKNGKKHGKMDEGQAKGLEANYVAELILKAIENRKRDCIPAGGKEKLAIFLNKWKPELLDKLLLKSEVT